MNWMNVYVLYYVVSMFVNDVVCDRDNSIFRKEDTRVGIIRMCIVWGFGGILTLLVHWIHIDEDYQLVKSQRRFICSCPRFEI